MANTRDIAYGFATDRFPEQIYLIVRSYHRQFDLDMWKVMVWNFRMMSDALHDFENENKIDTSPYYNFLAQFNDELCDLMFGTHSLDLLEKINQLKSDYIHFVSNLFRYIEEKEI